MKDEMEAALCILSPVPLILLGGASDTGVLNIPEDAAGGSGCVMLFLLILVALGVRQLVQTGIHWDRT